MRQALNWGILLMIPLVFAAIVLAGYFTYRKLTYPGYSCGSFAVPDDTIGWVLRPRATSCIGGREPFSDAPPWFESKVYTDDNGFRSGRAGGETRQGGVMAVGDSWTFGFGIDYQDSYAAQLEQNHRITATVVASPAYSTAQSLLLAERWAPKLKPFAIVFLDIGSWERAACRGSRQPAAIQKPCYWQSPNEKRAELVLPPAGRVSRLAAWGILPGGILGAGHITWSYFLLTRPYALVHQFLVRLGLQDGFGDDFRAVGVDNLAIQEATIEHAIHLADTAGVPILLLDPSDIYGEILTSLPQNRTRHIHRVGKAEWDAEIHDRTAGMAAEQIRVPKDGHYGPGIHRLIAELVARRMTDYRLLAADAK